MRGVVGWVPLDRPGEARQALELFARNPLLRGIRNLTHTYSDPEWILRPNVSETISWLPEFGLTLDYVSTTPRHLALLPELAAVTLVLCIRTSVTVLGQNIGDASAVSGGDTSASTLEG